MNQLGVFLLPLNGMLVHRRVLPPEWDASPSQGTPPWMGWLGRAHSSRSVNSDFCSMNQLGVFLLPLNGMLVRIAEYSPLDGMLVHRRVLPPEWDASPS